MQWSVVINNTLSKNFWIIVNKLASPYIHVLLVRAPVTKNKFRGPLEFVIMRLYCNTYPEGTR